MINCRTSADPFIHSTHCADAPREGMWSTEWAALWPAFLAATHDYVGFAFPPPSDHDNGSSSSSLGAVADSVRTTAVHLMGVAILTFTSAKLGMIIAAAFSHF